MKTTKFPKTPSALNTKRSIRFLRLLRFPTVLQRKSKKPPHKAPLMTHHLMKDITCFKKTKISQRALLYGTLQLVYSSLEEDPSRICMFTYRQNENPPEHGKLHMLTTFTTQKDFIVQEFNPKTADGHKKAYKAHAKIYRNGTFHDTWVIFTDRKRCTVLRTPGYHDLCELFTAGARTSGSMNNYCFFIYTMFCKEPAKKFTSLGDCWPPARQPKP
uniref:Putative salivary lipocalin n=1 Tax=Ixodes ricinus TaxID=34613 RepID=A0A0K8R2V6_IXORI